MVVADKIPTKIVVQFRITYMADDKMMHSPPAIVLEAHMGTLWGHSAQTPVFCTVVVTVPRCVKRTWETLVYLARVRWYAV